MNVPKFLIIGYSVLIGVGSVHCLKHESPDVATEALAIGFLSLPGEAAGDGSVSFSMLGSSRVWAKCPQASATGTNLYAGGGVADSCAGVLGAFAFCNESDNDCNGGTNTGLLDGNPGNLMTNLLSGSSQAYDSCASMTLAGRSDWRVPTSNELQTFFLHDMPLRPDLFSNTGSGYFWSADSVTGPSALAWAAGVIVAQSSPKSGVFAVRCIASP